MLKLVTCLPVLFCLPLTQVVAADDAPLFAESFEDTRLTSRGWYDGDRFVLVGRGGRR